MLPERAATWKLIISSIINEIGIIIIVLEFVTSYNQCGQ